MLAGVTYGHRASARSQTACTGSPGGPTCGASPTRRGSRGRFVFDPWPPPTATPPPPRRHPLPRSNSRRFVLACRALCRRSVSSIFDQFAKDLLDLLLSAHGRVELEFEVPALRSQRADVLFEPDPAHDAGRRTLGLLGRITATCCLLEPFHEAPDVAQVTGCLRKLLNHRHARSLDHRPAAERTWLLCAGAPHRALREFAARPMPGWPRGFHDLGDALPLSIVVLAGLDETPDTLALRLLGAGATMRCALVDLRAMPAGAVRDAIVRRVVELHHDRNARAPGTIDDPEEEELMKQLPFVEELERRCRDEGRTEGRAEGRTEGRTEGSLAMVLRIVERRLGRALSDAEAGVLRARVVRLGDRALDDALDLDAAALDAWLARGMS